MAGKKVGNSVVITQCAARLSGIEKHLAPKDTLFVQGEQVKGSDLAQVYQEALDTRASTVTAKGEYFSALASRNAAEAKRLATDGFLESYVVARFGATSTEAHDFGFVTKKKSAPTAVTRAKATLLAQATRTARGTMSEKEKQKIKGTLSADASAALEVLAGSASGGASSSAAPPPAGASTATAGSPPVVVSPPVVPAVNGAGFNGSVHN